MKVAVLCRVYNEEAILQDFLDHYRDIATGGFYFYDDGSTDNTWDILSADPAVKHIISKNRIDNLFSHFNQNPQRQEIVEAARQDLELNDWFLLLDADEFIEWYSKPEDHLTYASSLTLPLFDLYITDKDKDRGWKEREMVGPEVRYIKFMVKSADYITLQNDRTIISNGINLTTPTARVKHIGKGLSIDYWERKCSHYSTPGMPLKYQLKWANRKGKAIHTESDFGRPLLKWDELAGAEWITIQ